MTKRIYNFSAGPAVLPEEVLETVRENLLSYRGKNGATGIGLMEMSHRSAHFENIIEEAEQNLRALLGLSDNYAVIFTTGGATAQFSAVPMNLLGKGQVGEYIVTGTWAEKALEEASKFGGVHIAATSKDRNYCYLPEVLQRAPNSAYLHFTSNNTIFGTQYRQEPASEEPCLICDASSDFLHKPLEIEKYGLIYAGAQKNMGPAGVTLVIIRRDLLERIPAGLPLMLDYRTYVKHRSLYNTPPTLPIYVVGEVLKWLQKNGGLAEMYRRNQEKAQILYDAIEQSDFYRGFAEPKDRSLMNVTFRIADTDREPEFIRQAAMRGLDGLAGHRSVGGIRASIYNAFPIEGVRALVEFMREFERSA